MFSFYSILFWLLLGGICSRIAKKRNRNPLGWFFIGMLLGVIGLIILYVLPAKNEESLEEASPVPAAMQSQENLTFSTETEETLAPSEMNQVISPSFEKKLWYYLDRENKQYGPMSFDNLKRVWKEDQITGTTYVWNEEMPDWKPIADLPEVLDKIRNIPTN